MEKQIITKLSRTFEDYAYEEDGIEFWFARDLQGLLGYTELCKFQCVVEKAKESAKNLEMRYLTILSMPPKWSQLVQEQNGILMTSCLPAILAAA